LIETEDQRRHLEAARARQEVRLARRANAQAGEGEPPQDRPTEKT
jgi:hypothetical protein